MVLLCIMVELSFEDWMQKYVVPRQPLILLALQSLGDEVLRLFLKGWVYHQRLLLNVFDEFVFGICTPRGFAV